MQLSGAEKITDTISSGGKCLAKGSGELKKSVEADSNIQDPTEDLADHPAQPIRI